MVVLHFLLLWFLQVVLKSSALFVNFFQSWSYLVYVLHYFGGGIAFVVLELVFFKVFSVSRV